MLSSLKTLPSDARLLIIPNCFKGSLSSSQVAQSIAEGVQAVLPNARLCFFPLADGGSGSSIVAGSMLQAEKKIMCVHGPEGAVVESFYYLKANHAYVEVAAASGLSLVNNSASSPRKRTTYGTGELIRNAIENGARVIALFLGDSATVDGGVGLLKALGFQFFTAEKKTMLSIADCQAIGTAFPGERLELIHSLETEDAQELLQGVNITAVADVRNILCGENGAAHIFGPQKGASPEEVGVLESGLTTFASVVTRTCGTNYSDTPGAGAAGGIGLAVLGCLGGQIISGPEYFLDLIGFDKLMPSVDVVITGEGKVDRQSLNGKLLRELLQRTERYNKPLILFCGVSELEEDELQLVPHLHVFPLRHGYEKESPQLAIRNHVEAVVRAGKMLEFMPSINSR